MVIGVKCPKGSGPNSKVSFNLIVPCNRLYQQINKHCTYSTLEFRINVQVVYWIIRPIYFLFFTNFKKVRTYNNVCLFGTSRIFNFNTFVSFCDTWGHKLLYLLLPSNLYRKPRFLKEKFDILI